MPHFCININGQRHCFEIPVLINRFQIKPPPPNNYPPFELALAVQELLSVVRPLTPNSPLVKQLDEVSSKFINEVQAGLPKGVEFFHGDEVHEKTA